MTRWEARAALASAVLMVVAGLVLLVGAWGLLVPGLLLLLLVLFVVDVEGASRRAEAVEEPAPPAGRDHPVRPGRVRR